MPVLAPPAVAPAAPIETARTASPSMRDLMLHLVERERRAVAERR